MCVDDLLRSIKRTWPRLWRLLEYSNEFFIAMTWGSSGSRIDKIVEQSPCCGGISFKTVSASHLEECQEFLFSLNKAELAFFQPFNFDCTALSRVLSGRGFRCFTANINGRMIGFFFLRMAANRLAYLGFVVHRDFRGLGLGRCMIAALVDACRSARICLMSSVSENNTASMKVHEKNGFINNRTSAAYLKNRRSKHVNLTEFSNRIAWPDGQ